jgi:hypothetical protein
MLKNPEGVPRRDPYKDDDLYKAMSKSKIDVYMCSTECALCFPLNKRTEYTKLKGDPHKARLCGHNRSIVTPGDVACKRPEGPLLDS